MLRYQKTKFLLYCTYLLILFLKPNESAVQITTLNVGHGTSHIVIDAHATLLVDVGSRVNLDVGLTVLLPELKRLGVREIDKVIITHNDLDHCSGILDLFEHYKVQELFITPHTLKNQTKTIEKILFSAKSNGVFVKEIHKGWQTETKNVTVRSIWPEKTRVHSSSNEASVVLLVEAENRRVLLTGDINEAAISEVALQNLPVIDVLELPHHGQWSEESLGFVEELQPKVVLQSTSKRRFSSDKWLLPNTAERYVTCIDGHITTEITKKGELRVTTTYTKHNDLY
jgi:competence protein ComEC